MCVFVWLFNLNVCLLFSFMVCASCVVWCCCCCVLFVSCVRVSFGCSSCVLDVCWLLCYYFVVALLISWSLMCLCLVYSVFAVHVFGCLG